MSTFTATLVPPANVWTLIGTFDADRVANIAAFLNDGVTSATISLAVAPTDTSPAAPDQKYRIIPNNTPLSAFGVGPIGPYIERTGKPVKSGSVVLAYVSTTNVNIDVGAV